jgi:FixJ family two-component response regulator
MIYVVDDDEGVRSGLLLLLRALGWKARGFASAAEFLLVLREARPACLLLDLNMPGMNGAELQEYLVDHSANIPVVVITGGAEASLLARSRAAGARAIREKPVSENELMVALESAVAA